METLDAGSGVDQQLRCLQIVGAYASGIDDLAAVIELASAGRLDAGSWVSHRLGLEEFDLALEIAETRPPGTVRVVVEIDGE